MLYLLAGVVLIAWFGALYDVFSRVRTGSSRQRRSRPRAADDRNHGAAYFDSGGHVDDRSLTRSRGDHDGRDGTDWDVSDVGGDGGGGGGGDGGGGDGGGGD